MSPVVVIIVGRRLPHFVASRVHSIFHSYKWYVFSFISLGRFVAAEQLLASNNQIRIEGDANIKIPMEWKCAP